MVPARCPWDGAPDRGWSPAVPGAAVWSAGSAEVLEAHCSPTRRQLRLFMKRGVLTVG